MAKYEVGRPLSDVRLRNWDTGRLAQLKLAVQRLEAEVNRTLSVSSRQSAKRQISDQVPFILDLDVAPGFRQATVSYVAPPGLGGHPLRQLLFYEIQHDTSPAFANPVILQTPNTNVTIAGLGLGETRSFRARVVSTFNQASQWSEVITVTLAQNKIQQTAVSDGSVRLTRGVGDWQTVFDQTYQPVDAKSCVNVHLGLACPHFDVEKKASGVTREDLYGGPAFVQLRWIIGTFNDFTLLFEFREEGPRSILSARPGVSTEATDFNSVRTPTAFGTFMSPFFKPTAGVETRVILQAAKMPGTEWLGPTRGRTLEISDPIIFSRRGQILEVLEGF
jgi:hypothetical protein